MDLKLNENYFEEKAKQENNSDLWFICNFGIMKKVMDLYESLKNLDAVVNVSDYEISLDENDKHFLKVAKRHLIEIYDRYELFEEWNLFESWTSNCYSLEEFLDDYTTVTLLNYKSVLGDLEIWLYGFVNDYNSIIIEL